MAFNDNTLLDEFLQLIDLTDAERKEAVEKLVQEGYLTVGRPRRNQLWQRGLKGVVIGEIANMLSSSPALGKPHPGLFVSLPFGALFEAGCHLILAFLCLRSADADPTDFSSYCDRDGYARSTGMWGSSFGLVTCHWCHAQFAVASWLLTLCAACDSGRMRFGALFKVELVCCLFRYVFL